MYRLILEMIVATGIIYGGARLIAAIGTWLAEPRKKKDEDEFV